ncbi:hypothetical protein [Sphingobacterium phlebotomi]|uniref:hypothetical protein n=1 Tax=Sphingobacterium phlebotomi TaxID=2605433 RepID=UPI001653968C|nr:hypothetical protein [Sphingobacterium phlebotomi]
MYYKNKHTRADNDAIIDCFLLKSGNGGLKPELSRANPVRSVFKRFTAGFYVFWVTAFA